jgi:TIGR03009 family protein
MKPLALTLAAGLVAGSVGLAQAPAKDSPPAAQAPDMSEKNKQYLDAYLDAWEKRMAKVDGLETKIVFTEVDETGKKTVRTGDSAILKPNYAKMFLKLADDPTNAKKWMHFVADGEFLRQYDYAQKKAMTEQLPREGMGDNSMMSFLFMTRAADLKRRYSMSIDVDDPKRHTDHYLFIDIRPRTKDDMVEFKKAELVLWKNNKDEKFADRWMLPARLWFQKPNGEQIIWEFQNLSTKTRLLPRDFKAPGFPDKEWKPEWIRPPTQPIIPTGGTKK